MVGKIKMFYGCIAEKLGHSFSKDIHNRLFDYSYELREVPKDELDAFMRAKDFKAINVTIPYKQSVIPYLDHVSDTAKSIGAVNTIVNKDGVLYGYNTDFSGLTALIKRNGIVVSGKKVLILGSGGTSRTARAVAKDLNAREILVVSRAGKEGITYEEARQKHRDAEILINTTPCGMYPNIRTVPLDVTDYPNLEGVVDAVYNPLRTELVLQAQERGIPAVCGLYMLVAQAAFAVELFLDTTVPEEKIEAVFRSLTAAKENIVLTGMPGSGKTTVGNQLKKKLCKPFWDTDLLLTERAGRTPAEIINSDGEPAFRDLECAVIRDIAAENGGIIATGGGAVLRDENIKELKRNGRIYFLDRPLEEILPTDDRPLSGNRELLQKRYNERYARYCATADHIISPASVLDEVCEQIIEDMNL